MDYFLTILGTVVTVASLLFALNTNSQLAKLEDYNREQAWEIYRQASITLGFYQKMNDLKINNSDFIKLNSAGERASIELVIDCVRMIKRFEKKYSEEEIQKWLKAGKLINDTHVQTFRNFI